MNSYYNNLNETISFFEVPIQENECLCNKFSKTIYYNVYICCRRSDSWREKVKCHFRIEAATMSVLPLWYTRPGGNPCEGLRLPRLLLSSRVHLPSQSCDLLCFNSPQKANLLLFWIKSSDWRKFSKKVDNFESKYSSKCHICHWDSGA